MKYFIGSSEDAFKDKTMNTYRLGQAQDWMKEPDVSMLTHPYLNDAISQATGTILYIYQDKTLLAAQDVLNDIRQLIQRKYQIMSKDTDWLETARYFDPQSLRIMLEHKIFSMLEGMK
jgi:hypothetical protein